MSMDDLRWLPLDDEDSPLPEPSLALREPNGLLAVGGRVTARRLLQGYRTGIFAWFGAGEPPLWWSPDPRGLLDPRALHVPRSLRKTLRRARFELSFDRAFRRVVRACAAPRPQQPETWINPMMLRAYAALAQQGHAHSVEVWEQGRLVGGLFGIAQGRAFFGESMFCRASDASKVALLALCRHLVAWGFDFVDTQMVTPHMALSGAITVPRAEYLERLREALQEPGPQAGWVYDEGFLRVAAAGG